MSSVAQVIAETVYVFASVLKLLFLVRILFSWIPAIRNARGFIGRLVGIVNSLTEPILGFIRGVLQKSPVAGVNSFIDFSPILSYFLVDTVALLLINIILAI